MNQKKLHFFFFGVPKTASSNASNKLSFRDLPAKDFLKLGGALCVLEGEGLGLGFSGVGVEGTVSPPAVVTGAGSSATSSMKGSNTSPNFVSRRGVLNSGVPE